MFEKPKDDGPETLAQAAFFETNKNRYLRDGLCHVCAAQAGFGHQLSFSRVHPPCETCQPIVDKFPYPTVEGSPWRKTLRPGDAKKADERIARRAAAPDVAKAAP